jgi:hypothetical protein
MSRKEKRMSYVSKALNNLCPNAKFYVVGDDLYENIVWEDDDVAKPSEQIVMAEAARLQSDYESAQYQRQREKEYPAIGDQLDALWKGGDAAEAMLAQVMAIKAKYPKTEGA